MLPLDISHAAERRERHSRRLRGLLALGVLIALALVGRPVEERSGASGTPYAVFRVSERWAPAGSAIVVRYRSDASSRSDAAREAADLLPSVVPRAEAAGLGRVVVQANAPLLRVGRGAGIYREWHFRFAERDGEWIPEQASPIRY